MNKTIFTVNKGDTLRITYTHSIIKKAIRKELVCRYGRRDIKEYEEGLFPASKLPESALKKAKNILDLRLMLQNLMIFTWVEYIVKLVSLRWDLELMKLFQRQLILLEKIMPTIFLKIHILRM